jgi:hypothetical protein
MPLDITSFGYTSNLWDNLSPADNTVTKLGGYCIPCLATTAMSPGDAVVIDTAAPASDTAFPSVKTVASANSTAGVGFYYASQGTTPNQWDSTRTAASGDLVMVQVDGVVKGTASTAISAGALVGTSSTAGQVVTTSTASANLGRALSAASVQGDKIYILVSR